jgi:hypothetical protein
VVQNEFMLRLDDQYDSASDGAPSNFVRFLCGIAIAVRPTVWVRRFEVIISKCVALEVCTIERYVNNIRTDTSHVIMVLPSVSTVPGCRTFELTSIYGTR